MSTELTTEMLSHKLTEFWGGDERGVCAQVTALSPTHGDNGEGYIQMTMAEAAALCNDLSMFVKREALRRQSLLRQQLSDLKMRERTVFSEVSELAPELFDAPTTAVNLVDQFCPKV